MSEGECLIPHGTKVMNITWQTELSWAEREESQLTSHVISLQFVRTSREWSKQNGIKIITQGQNSQHW